MEEVTIRFLYFAAAYLTILFIVLIVLAIYIHIKIIKPMSTDKTLPIKNIRYSTNKANVRVKVTEEDVEQIIKEELGDYYNSTLYVRIKNAASIIVEEFGKG